METLPKVDTQNPKLYTTQWSLWSSSIRPELAWSEPVHWSASLDGQKSVLLTNAHNSGSWADSLMKLGTEYTILGMSYSSVYFKLTSSKMCKLKMAANMATKMAANAIMKGYHTIWIGISDISG